MGIIFNTNKHSDTWNDAPLLSSDDIAALAIQASQVQFSSLSTQPQQSNEAGWLPTKALGSGMDYAESREYQQGDDPRYINWRLSARSNDTFVKTYHMEARPTLCVVLDVRRSMIFGTQKRLKITQAVRIATLLAHVAQQHDLNLNALVVSDEKTQWLGKQSLDSLLAYINHYPDTKPLSNQVLSFQALINTLQVELKSGSLVYMISDFLNLAKSDTKAFSQLLEKHFIQALHIIDQAEQKLPKSGGVSLQAFNQNNKLNLNTDRDDIRSSIDDLLTRKKNHINDVFKQAGLLKTDVPSDQDTLYNLLDLPFGH